MIPEAESLARRAVACRGWRWMPGMACLWKRPGGAGGQQVLPTWARVADLPMGPLPLTFCIVDAGSVYRGALPDLTDPATLGCLLALVREAYESEAPYVRLSDTRRKSDGLLGWEIIGWLDPSRSPDGRGGSFRGWGYASEAEALVAALEAAP